MRFLYRPIVSAPPDGGDYLLILRPEIPLTVIGPASSGSFAALVDTGSDNTILPKSIAEPLGIPLRVASGSSASAFGGQRLSLLDGEATLQLEADGKVIRWPSELLFFDFPNIEDETVILGHAGFLDYFTATFDGEMGVLDLVANDDLPATV